MKPTILVTGAPGNVGSEVVRGLEAKGIPIRVGAFHPESARATFGETIEVTHFDFLNPETFAKTFEGIERMFLIRPPALSNVDRDIAPAVRAAVDAGVKHIVFLSLQGVENNRVVPHYKIEQFILSVDVKYTFLRASFFMQNLSTTQAKEIRERNEIGLPVGKAKTSFIDVRDIGAVAVCALTEETHYNKSYTLTGSEALDYYEVASIFSSILKRNIRYTNPNVILFVQTMLAENNKLGYTLVVAALYTITRFGNAKEITHDVETLLKRAPILFEQFVKDYQDVWKPNISKA